MDKMDAVRERHAVRDYTEKPIDSAILTALQEEINRCNAESGLHIQLISNEPEAFSGFLARYGKFNNVRNYIALIGARSSNLDETIGYYGERIALTAQQLGLNTCWVAVTFSKRKSKCSIDVYKRQAFSDTAEVADYAKDAVQMLTASGIIAGAGGKINPKGKTTRAEVAVIDVYKRQCLKRASISSSLR